MKDRGARFPFFAVAVIMVCAVVASLLACVLTSDEACMVPAGDSLLGRLLGESRRAFGEKLNIEADRYFHRGVRHPERLAFVDYIQRLRDEVQPRSHEHLSDTETFEVMPWLRFATRMDPHNVNAYLGAAFWTAAQDGYLDQAMGILDEARKENPENYRIPLQRGTILLHYGNIDDASRAFDRALRLWPAAPRVDDEQKRIDLAALLNYRGFLYEVEGQREDALHCYRRSLCVKPESKDLRVIVRKLERGERSRAEAERTLRAFLRKGMDADDRCTRDDEHAPSHGLY
jgi:tetratricopeptide (TPR) repeat protein